ncbi:alpha/beta hydrolase family protein [Paraburkholderia antibiotica]|uniref:Fungal lipase-like domain-containing protein n=1 Tax=Paraburkholderia antibiotica TaxID=2728839 RepID=A0A7X9X6B5_9BURK|nr:hypothetical protein [Paraburkholderia antibiotica]NML31737.1 hypothetical protein [Paraburkholderia antibiotica]
MTTEGTLPGQLTGMQLAKAAYPTNPNNPLPANEQVSSDWVDVSVLVNFLQPGYNTQYKLNSDGTPSTTLENQFVIKVNQSTKQIVISFKGSDALSNWTSDLTDGGASEYLKIVDQVQAAYDALSADSVFAGYTFSTTGHSLGGAMAQTFALKNGLDVQVYNSLPIPSSLVANGISARPISMP